jgi:hypothetical protein
MSNILGTVVADAIVPLGSNATHYDAFGQQGFMSVPTLTERDALPVGNAIDEDAISSGRRKADMFVYVVSEAQLYRLHIADFAQLTNASKLVALADNTNWEEANLGGDVDKAYVDAADATLQAAISTEKNRIDNLVTGAPGALDTLAEIAAQLASDEAGAAAILATQQQHTQELANVVHKTGDESIDGVKTFISVVKASEYRLGNLSFAKTLPGKYPGNVANGYTDLVFNTDDSYKGIWNYATFWRFESNGTAKGVTIDNTGSIYSEGNVKATAFIGDGSQLTGIPPRMYKEGTGYVAIIPNNNEGNEASGYRAGVASGGLCRANGSGSFIGGGYNNLVSAGQGFIGGGYQHVVSGYGSVIGGGAANKVTNQYSVIAGGDFNTITGQYSAIDGGSSNKINSDYSSISGGYHNTINSNYGAIYNSDSCTIAAGCSYTTLINCSGLNVTTGTNQVYINNQLYVPGGSGGVSKTYVDSADTNLQNQINQKAANSDLTYEITQRTNADSNLQSQITTNLNNAVYQLGANSGTLVKKGWSNQATAYQSAVLAGESSSAIGEYSTVFSGYINVTRGHWSSIIGGTHNTYDTTVNGNQAFGAIVGSNYCTVSADFCFVSNSTNCTIASGCNYTTLIGCTNLNVTTGSNQTYINNQLYIASVGTTVKTSATVTFERDAEYNPISSGTFTVDNTAKAVGAVVSIYLTPSATQPTIPTTGYKLIGGAYEPGKNLMYMFKVGANNQIQYTITNVD